MRKIIVFLLISICLGACQNNRPETVAERFVKAMNQNRFREAQRYVDAESALIIDEIIEVLKSNGEKLSHNKKVDFSLQRIEETDENSVLVYYTIKEGGEENHLHLKREGDDWKVSLEFMQEGDPHQHCSH
ncbi:DUF4878 domain-containing protein [Capnocytophaga sp.]|uniref:DUF4878 domain-containing protein n=1 Tax=Capnocytophaga sp. TaxID=44737 RepID=UPI0026DD1B7B|nr:DUF4878 domain-containing protein [Capnocytophaga sp.]MDO5106464.1 DUF4878 domain-containing protein [Capnocytophaga sp.]